MSETRLRRRCLTAIALASCLALDQSPVAQTLSRPSIPFATYLGSSQVDVVTAIETDSSGAVYLTGFVNDATTLSFPFWTTIGSPFGTSPCFLARLIPDGNGGLTYTSVALIRDGGCTEMTLAPGGEVVLTGGNQIVDIYADNGAGGFTRTRRVPVPQISQTRHARVDQAGNTYVTGLCAQEGTPASLWPLPRGAQPNPASGLCRTPGSSSGLDFQDVLVVIDAAGHVTYGTFLGSSFQTEVSALELDAGGRVVLAGQTTGLVHVTSDAFQPQAGNTACTSNCHPDDAFLMVIDATGDGLPSVAYSSYFGGTSQERDVAMLLDDNGRVHLAGNTSSRETFPGVSFTDAGIFLSILDISQPPASQLVSSHAVTDSGATDLLPRSEVGRAIQLMPNGSVALMADATVPYFLVNPIYSGPYDVNAENPLRPMLLVYDPSAGAITFGTFLDDRQLVRVPHIAADPSGDLYVAMATTEAGRSTDGTQRLGADDDLLVFRIGGLASPIDQNADLAVTASASASQIQAFDAVAYTVTLTNNGPLDASAPRLVATVPSGMQFQSASNAGCSFAPPSVSCELPRLPSGQSVAVSITTRAVLVGSFSTTFVVISPENDPDPANNSASLSGSADLVISETVHVSDNDPTPQPALMLSIAETIHVSDSDSINVVLTPVTTGGVPVQPTDHQGMLQPINVTFTQVMQPGVITADPLSPIPALPSGFVLKGAAYDIQTTAGYAPPVTICFTGSYTAQDSLLHFESSAWVDVTTTRTAVQICGQVSTLSPFAVATREGTQPRISTRIAGQGVVSGNRKYVDLELTNTGNGQARQLALDLVFLLPIKGFGIPKPVLPNLPASLGMLDAGKTTIVRVVFDAPTTVKEILITAIGTFRNAKGALGAYLETERIVP